MSTPFTAKHATCTCSASPLERRKSNAPSRKSQKAIMRK